MWIVPQVQKEGVYDNAPVCLYSVGYKPHFWKETKEACSTCMLEPYDKPFRRKERLDTQSGFWIAQLI